MKVKLCKNCIEDLGYYNPYKEPITVVKVEEKRCRNYTVDGKFVNIKEGSK